MLSSSRALRDLHSFPTRRSSDLSRQQNAVPRSFIFPVGAPAQSLRRSTVGRTSRQDRKSTRLNSSHTVSSYAVFCLKKKNPCPVKAVQSRNPQRLCRSTYKYERA